MDAEALVRDYLGRLDAAAAPLPPSRRAELAGEVRQHIEMALAEAGGRDEITVRNVLDRLGPPDDIVEAERGPGSTASAWTASGGPAVAARSGWGAVEVVAILLLTLGAVFLPVIGPLLGLLFVWASTQWTTRQKLIATAIVVVLVLLPILLLLGLRAGGGASGQL